jgi:hypothetical protein
MRYTNKKAEGSTDSVMKWIIGIAIIIAGTFAFRQIFTKLS